MWTQMMKKIVLFNRDKIMNDLMKNVRIVEVYSDVAGHKKRRVTRNRCIARIIKRDECRLL